MVRMNAGTRCGRCGLVADMTLCNADGYDRFVNATTNLSHLSLMLIVSRCVNFVLIVS